MPAAELPDRNASGLTQDQWRRLCQRAFENLATDTTVTMNDVDAILTWCLPEYNEMRLPDRAASLRTTAAFIEHVTTVHGFGGPDALTDAVAIPSPATRAYHEHLHEQGGQDHTHDPAELAGWRAQKVGELARQDRDFITDLSPHEHHLALAWLADRYPDQFRELRRFIDERRRSQRQPPEPDSPNGLDTWNF